MKFLKALILFTIICMSYTLKINRVEKANRKLKSNTKADDGEGSWNGGYRVPGLLVVTGTAGFNNDNRLGKGRFFAPKLENPVTAEENLGWVFDMSTQAPTGDLLKVMVKIGTTNNWYIPFRWLNSDFGFTNPTGYKYLDGWISNDEKALFHLRVLLPYAYIGWVINDDEGKKIAGLLNTRRSQHKAIVEAKKTGANTAASTYLANKPLFDSASGDASKLKAEKDKQAALVVSLTADQKTKQTQFDTNEAALNKLEAQTKPLKTAQYDLNTAISGVSSQINQSLLAMDGGAKAADLAKTFDAKVQSAKTDLAKNLAELTAEAPIRSSEITAASTAILTANDQKAFTASLTKVFP